MNNLRKIIVIAFVGLPSVCAYAQTYTISGGQTVDWTTINSGSYDAVLITDGTLDISVDETSISNYTIDIGTPGGNINISDFLTVNFSNTIFNVGIGSLTIGNTNNTVATNFLGGSRINVGNLTFNSTQVLLEDAVWVFNAQSLLTLDGSSYLSTANTSIIELDLDSFFTSGSNQWQLASGLINANNLGSVIGANSEVFTEKSTGTYTLETSTLLWTLNLGATGGTLSMQAIPEPSAYGLLSGAMILGLMAVRRKRK